MANPKSIGIIEKGEALYTMDDFIVGSEEALVSEYAKNVEQLRFKNSISQKRFIDQVCRDQKRSYVGKPEKRSNFRSIFKKKGIGKAMKEKGKTMPTICCLNSKCAKGWARTQRNNKESFSALWIWEVT